MRGPSPWLIVALTGCNQVLGIPAPAHAPDAGPAGCDPDAPFTTLAPVDGLNTPDRPEQSLWLSRDELTAVLSRDMPGSYGDLFVAQRTDRHGAFQTPIVLDELRSPLDEYSASLSDGGLTIYFDRQIDRATGYRIYTASRTTPDGRFGTPVVVPVIDGLGPALEPFATADGLFFASSRNTGLQTLYYAARVAGGYGAPYPVIRHGTAVSDESPVVSFDGLHLYFASARSPSEPDAEIWTASRATPGAPFGDARRVDSAGSPSLDSPSWLSEDSCRLYLSSDRGGTRDFWVAERDPR